MPLQKSYSDQARQSKAHWPQRQSHWQRSITLPAAATPKPPVPVSSITKRKLDKFQFRERDTETKTTIGRANSSNEEPGDPLMPLKLQNGAIKPDEEHTKPSTATRETIESELPSKISWNDLMDTPRPRGQLNEISPTDRLLWDDSRTITVASPLVGRSGKKRARSSSPASSPVSGDHTNVAIDEDEMNGLAKPMSANLEHGIWSRKSPNQLLGTTALAASNPALAHLMVSSSPRPPRQGAITPGEKSFRRAFSDGSQWSKRRRIELSSPGATRDVVAKSTMITALLDVVNGQLEQPAPVSPRKSPRKATISPKKTDILTISPARTPPRRTQSQPAQTPSSNYGDDDFDDDTLMELDAVLTISQLDKVDTSASHTRRNDGTWNQNSPPKSATRRKIKSPLKHSESATQSTPTRLRHNPPRAEKPDLAEDDDEYGDAFDADFDFEAAELAATQSISASLSNFARSTQKSKAIQRYLVTTVSHTTYRDEHKREVPEIVLVLSAERTGAINTVHLRGDWIDTPVSIKSYVHIVGNFELDGRCIIDNGHNLLILHPDQLISATVVADSFSCIRRAVLQDRVKASNEASAPLVYGTMLHEIFQEALLANNWDSTFLGAVIDKIILKHVEDLYTIRISNNIAREHLLSKMGELQIWADRFVSLLPRSDALAQGRNSEKTNMSVSKLLDIEEHVWSPMYGLKGNIDATVQVTVKDGLDLRNLTVPFELKTGKNVSENHQAQTMLYNLLLSDRYDIEIAYGVLYYMETSLTKIVPSVRNELRHMIKQRNSLASHIRERSVQLPPMKKSKHACGNCYAQTSCFIYHKLADDGDEESSGVKDKFNHVVKHLTPVHRQFFLKWEDLLTKEEKESQKLRRELWTMLSPEREKLGRCFANVIIEPGSAMEDDQDTKINRYRYVFVKEQMPVNFSFMESQIAVGEPIVVSDEQGHFALALGYVTSVRRNRISVAVDRRLHNARIRQSGFDEVDNQTFASIMDVAPEGSRPEATQGKIRDAPIRYRVDKDEFSNGMALVRNNLIQIMADANPSSRDIRRLVVDLEAPKFKTVSTQYCMEEQASLNEDQKRAVEKVMSAKDYALVLGMPGTGKTTTIAHIIRALVLQKKSVLLTSYTHTAVDNILLKLKGDKTPILRLGAPAKVHPEVQDFVILAGRAKETPEDIRSSWHDTPIVATTCLGIDHPIFNERTFDYCIVDEASQITLPICVGPLRMARTFVLVGDHYQLPPLVQNEEARKGGLDISLFKVLSDAHPDSVVNLEHQYRMSEDIMTLSNALIYNGRLKCGTEALRTRKLDVPNLGALDRHHYDASTLTLINSPSQKSICVGSDCWLGAVLEPSTRVSFLNTDSIPDSSEEAQGNRIVNHAEARIATQLVEALLSIGIPASEIGVMTHYRSQLSLLKHSLRNATAANSVSGSIEMHTADRFQGRDKEVIVLSLVRSNQNCSIGELLKDWRRINVAFTRAKSKLLVIGSRSTLKGSGEGEMLAKFIGLMEEKAWIYDLPADALDSHLFQNAATQLTVTADDALSPVKVVRKCAAPPQQRLATTTKENSVKGLGLRTPLKSVNGKMSGKGMLKDRPVLRDILNEMTNGAY